MRRDAVILRIASVRDPGPGRQYYEETDKRYYDGSASAVYSVLERIRAVCRVKKDRQHLHFLYQ